MRRIVFFAFVVWSFAPNGRAQSQTQELILPVALNGYTVRPVHYQTTLRIVNISATPIQVTAEAYQNDGTAVRIFGLFPVTQGGTKTTFQIESGGSVEAFTAEDVPNLNGWIRLTFDASAMVQASAEVALINAPVAPHPICMRPSTEILSSFQTPAVQAALKSNGFAVIRPNRQSAFAVVNPSVSQMATVYVSLMDFNGRLVGSATLQVPPQGRISRFVRELIPAAPEDFMGTLRITSSIPVALGAVNVLLPEGKFTAINVASPPPVTCVQVLAAARNPLTNECRVFPTPCHIPDGWLPTGSSSCPADR
jgi:hypothetical protein